MSKKDIKQVEIKRNYGSYKNVTVFNQTIYQNKTRKANGEGYYYTLKTVVPMAIYNYLEPVDDIIYLVEMDDAVVVSSTVPGDDALTYYRRKLNAKSHNFTVPKQLFDEDDDCEFVANFIFIPSDSRVLVEFH